MRFSRGLLSSFNIGMKITSGVFSLQCFLPEGSQHCDDIGVDFAACHHLALVLELLVPSKDVGVAGARRWAERLPVRVAFHSFPCCRVVHSSGGPLGSRPLLLHTHCCEGDLLLLVPGCWNIGLSQSLAQERFRMRPQDRWSSCRWPETVQVARLDVALRGHVDDFFGSCRPHFPKILIAEEYGLASVQFDGTVRRAKFA